MIKGIRFTKMHGLGNDFMMINAVQQSISLNTEQIVLLGKRDTGIGFDQCLIVEPSQQADIDFFYRIFNADGHEVGQCGNGARCLARFIQQQQLTDKTDITVATRTTQMQLHIQPDGAVTVDMMPPKLHPKDIPLDVPNQESIYLIPFENGQVCQVHALNVGNPHAVIVVPSVDNAAVQSLGKKVSEHPLFTEQTNVGFMSILSPEHIRLRVYERGCGETKACGSGAVAAAVVGRLFHQLAKQVRVSLPGGDLWVSWPTPNAAIALTGPATFVYEGILC